MSDLEQTRLHAACKLTRLISPTVVADPRGQLTLHALHAVDAIATHAIELMMSASFTVTDDPLDPAR